MSHDESARGPARWRALSARLLPIALALAACGAEVEPGPHAAEADPAADAQPGATQLSAPRRDPAAASVLATRQDLPTPGARLPEGAQWHVTPSGLHWVALSRSGHPDAPRPADGCDLVRVHFTGMLEDGHSFDRSRIPGPPSSFRLAQLIPGWSEGLQLMRVGDHFKFHVPWELGFGEPGNPPRVPPRSNLVLDVELLGVTPSTLPAAPQFLSPDEGQLTRTPSGLGYRVLHAGNERRALPIDQVTVLHAGWLADGTPFVSSWVNCEPERAPLNRVLPGLTEGLQLVGEGGVIRLVIPPELAYGEAGRPPLIPPRSELVFHVEMLAIGR